MDCQTAGGAHFTSWPRPALPMEKRPSLQASKPCKRKCVRMLPRPLCDSSNNSELGKNTCHSLDCDAVYIARRNARLSPARIFAIRQSEGGQEPRFLSSRAAT